MLIKYSFPSAEKAPYSLQYIKLSSFKILSLSTFSSIVLFSKIISSTLILEDKYSSSRSSITCSKSPLCASIESSETKSSNSISSKSISFLDKTKIPPLAFFMYSKCLSAIFESISPIT